MIWHWVALSKAKLKTWKPGAQWQGWQHEASSRVEWRDTVDRGGQGLDAVLWHRRWCDVDHHSFQSPSSRNSSEFFCSAVSVFPFPFLDASAGVAVFLTPLTTTVQLAVVECWGRRFALETAKICREAGGRVATNLFEEP